MRLRVGLIAPESPPRPGGMASYAHGLTKALAASSEVWACTYPDGDLSPAKQLPFLGGQLDRDARIIAGADVDVWVALNAGLVPLAPRARQPFFAYFHGNDFLNPWIPYASVWVERLKRPYLWRVRRRLRRRAIGRSFGYVRHSFAISRKTAELMEREIGIRAERITICPPGVDDEFFQERTHRSGTHLRLLTVAALRQGVSRKNVDGVLGAIRLLEARIPIHYTVVGDGDERSRLEKLAAELGIARNVDFKGTVAKSELLQCYANADLFILASKASQNDVEGFGIVYLEASAAGVPVICSREGGSIDAVEEGRNGFLIPSSSPEDIAAGIERFVQTRQDFHARRVRAFAEGFRWSTIADRLLRDVEWHMQKQ